MEKFKIIGNQVDGLMLSLRKECISYIINAVDKHGDEDGSISLYNEQIDIDGDSLYISYDGGNHPEYASNLYSQVYDVHKDANGKVVLHIEDSDSYELERCTTMELYELANFIMDIIDNDDEVQG
jgi:hypothetical protein